MFLSDATKHETGDLVYVNYKDGRVVMTQAFLNEEEENQFNEDQEFIGSNSIWNVISQYEQTVKSKRYSHHSRSNPISKAISKLLLH